MFTNRIRLARCVEVLDQRPDDGTAYGKAEIY